MNNRVLPAILKASQPKATGSIDELKNWVESVVMKDEQKRIAETDPINLPI